MNNHLYQTLKSSPWGFMKVRERLMHHPDHQRKRVVPPVLVLFSILSVQLGAALAKSLFPAIGSGGTVFLRVGLAALVLLLVWRPHLRAYTRANYALVALFGLTIAAVNAAFYAAIARIPLGIAVTLEFVGPLGVAFVASRRRSDLLWAGLAAGGVLLLAPIGNLTIDPLGVGLALVAGGCWAAYIPLGVASGRGMLLDPRVLLVGCGVAVLSTLIPFSLELEALRLLPARVFGVLMSLEPAIAALIGWVVLKETTGLRALVALTLIMVASGGASLFQKHNAGDER
jgi:inner membrane transporter RhtA